MTTNDVITILQKYKTAKMKLLGKRIHLTWNDGIDWSEAAPPTYRREPTFEEEQYAAGVLCQVVEEWLNLLTVRDAKILFYAYINHDYERAGGRYKTLSNR